MRIVFVDPNPPAEVLDPVYVTFDKYFQKAGICTRTWRQCLVFGKGESRIMPDLYVNTSENRCGLERCCIDSQCLLNKTSKAYIRRKMAEPQQILIRQHLPEIVSQCKLSLQQDPTNKTVSIKLW